MGFFQESLEITLGLGFPRQYRDTGEAPKALLHVATAYSRLDLIPLRYYAELPR